MRIDKTQAQRTPEKTMADLLSAQMIEYKSFAPELKIKHKRDLWVWRLTPKKSRLATTTIGTTIWLGLRESDNSDKVRRFTLLAHEFQHVLDFKKFGFFGFMALYLYPQIFALVPLVATVALFAMGGPYIISASIVANLILLFLMPWDTRTRMEIEIRGYSMNLAVAYMLTGRIPVETRMSVQKSLKSPIYYGMAKGNLIDVVTKMVENVRGPRWPKNLSAFGPTAAALLETHLMHPSCKSNFVWSDKETKEGKVPEGKTV